MIMHQQQWWCFHLLDKQNSFQNEKITHLISWRTLNFFHYASKSSIISFLFPSLEAFYPHSLNFNSWKSSRRYKVTKLLTRFLQFANKNSTHKLVANSFQLFGSFSTTVLSLLAVLRHQNPEKCSLYIIQKYIVQAQSDAHQANSKH